MPLNLNFTSKDHPPRNELSKTKPERCHSKALLVHSGVKLRYIIYLLKNFTTMKI